MVAKEEREGRSPNSYPTVGPVQLLSRQYPSVPSLSVPEMLDESYVAVRKYWLLSKGVLNETRARIMAAASDRRVPGVAERYRTAMARDAPQCSHATAQL